MTPPSLVCKNDMEKQEAGKTREEKGKRFQNPNKQFQWTDKLRELLCDVVRLEMVMYELFKSTPMHQTAAAYLQTYLDAEVRPLWPPDWMQTETLMHRSSEVHFMWTGWKYVGP